jgi:hypothetical protein
MNVVVIPEKPWSHIFWDLKLILLGLAPINGTAKVFNRRRELSSMKVNVLELQSPETVGGVILRAK